MVATILISMLCVHLLCFAVMFLLFSRRLLGKKMGMDLFAAGNLILGAAYVLQLIESTPQWSVMNALNHTFTLTAPLLYFFGGLHFFGKPIKVWPGLLLFAAAYLILQFAIHIAFGPVARFALLAGACTVLFFFMTVMALWSMRTLAKDLRAEMSMFAVLIAGICVLNAIKFFKLIGGGLEAINMESHFQMVFYIYMCSLATIIPPAIIWLVLLRLTDDLHVMASHDPLTQLLNRRGLDERIKHRLSGPLNTKTHLLLIDIDHFKKINDTFGHHVGDMVLSKVANTIKQHLRTGDIACRIGGEEFLVISFSTSDSSAMNLAERLRHAIEQETFALEAGTFNVTATIGVSLGFSSIYDLDEAMRQADTAMYFGKSNGRNRTIQGQTVHSKAA